MLVNPWMVNGGRSRSFSQQNARLSAFSPENMRFKNPVKYNLSSEINQNQGGGA
jgi:hypothetical protein